MSMSLPSIITDNHFEIGFVRSTDNAASRAKQLVELNGHYRTRKFDMKGMGSNAKVNNVGLLTMLGNTKVLALNGEAVAFEDERTRENQLKIDLVRAFGGEIASMGAFVGEIMAGIGPASTMPAEQQATLVEMVGEIITVKNMMRLSPLPEGQAVLEKRIATIAEKISNTLISAMDNAPMAAPISPAIVAFTRDMLATIATDYNAPEIAVKVMQIDGRTNPQAYSAQAVEAITAQLSAVLATDAQISEEQRAAIVEAIEQLTQAKESGHPIPPAALNDLVQFISQSPEIFPAASFAPALQTLSDANTVLLAETSGASIAQIQQGINAALDSIAAPAGETATVMATETTTQIPAPATDHAAPQVIELATPIAAITETPASTTTTQSTTVPSIGGKADVAVATDMAGAVDTVSVSVSVSVPAPSPVASVANSTPAPASITPEPQRAEITPAGAAVIATVIATKTAPTNVQPTAVKAETGKQNPTPNTDKKTQPTAPNQAQAQVQDPKQNNAPAGANPCGKGACDCPGDFNKSAQNKPQPRATYAMTGNDVVVTAPNGKTETISIPEAEKRINVEMVNTQKITPDDWKNIVAQNGGDVIKARQEVMVEKEKIATVTQEIFKTVEVEDASGMDQFFKFTPADKNGASNLSDLFTHKCGAGCNHGPTPQKGEMPPPSNTQEKYQARRMDETPANQPGDTPKKPKAFRGPSKPRVS